MSSDQTTNEPLPVWLSIVGLGEDGLAGLGKAARTALADAAFVFGGKRHLRLAAGLIEGKAQEWPSPFDPDFAQIVNLRGQRVCVLASGDPFFYGVGASLSRVVDPGQMQVFPAPSSFSLAAARLGWPLQDVELLSLHARPVELLRPLLQPGRRIIALTTGRDSPAQIAAWLCELGFGATCMTVLEALGGPDERSRAQTAQDFDLEEIRALNLVALEVKSSGPDTRVLPNGAGLPDDWFEHDGQISKRDIRALTLSALQPRAGGLLWDIGAGSGSVAIEWLLSGADMRAVAIEQNPERAARIEVNARRFGVPFLEVITGKALEVLSDLPQPDAVFVGGGGTEPGLMEAAISALRPGGRLVATGVTLEMETVLAALADRKGGTLIRIAVARRAPLGSLHTFRPALPVTQWAWTKPQEGPQEGPDKAPEKEKEV